MKNSTSPPASTVDRLIVDDDADRRERLRFDFNPLGYRTESAAIGREAIKLCERSKPRLILLDVKLPGPGGYEVYQAVRAVPDTSNTSIIFLT